MNERAQSAWTTTTDTNHLGSSIAWRDGMGCTGNGGEPEGHCCSPDQNGGAEVSNGRASTVGCELTNQGTIGSGQGRRNGKAFDCYRITPATKRNTMKMLVSMLGLTIIACSSWLVTGYLLGRPAFYTWPLHSTPVALPSAALFFVTGVSILVMSMRDKNGS